MTLCSLLVDVCNNPTHYDAIHPQGLLYYGIKYNQVMQTKVYRPNLYKCHIMHTNTRGICG
jgi:hypothetical protein